MFTLIKEKLSTAWRAKNDAKGTTSIDDRHLVAQVNEGRTEESRRRIAGLAD